MQVATQAGPRCLTAKTKVSRAGLSAAAQPSSETLDENDIFDDDAPLLSDIQISTTPDAARASVLTDSFQVIRVAGPQLYPPMPGEIAQHDWH